MKLVSRGRSSREETKGTMRVVMHGAINFGRCCCDRMRIQPVAKATPVELIKAVRGERFSRSMRESVSIGTGRINI